MPGIEFIDSNNLIVNECNSNSSITEPASNSIRSDLNLRPSNPHIAADSAYSSGVSSKKRSHKTKPKTSLAYVGVELTLKGSTVDNKQLKKRISNLVWDLLIEPEDFEQRWTTLMEEYNLTDHDWLGEMYAIRHRWVPTSRTRYFNSSCLMKTTSRCESSNAMFKVNTNKSNTLLQFLVCFDTAIDGQQQKQRELKFRMMTTTTICTTPLLIERHASEIYTPTLFRLVQKEIDRGFLSCSTSIPTVIGCVKLYNVVQYNQMLAPVCTFEVHGQEAVAAAKVRAAKASAVANVAATVSFPDDGLSSFADDARTSFDVST
ncbi:hypothetical protein SSX86_023238 [Deinandra increscens subsp. villosa]|uniref:Protein FAR1-RELATED SEQUENCE n=1 Tax=Deinandra increscens subsp. villosa TaxID=3103831 RepID=A0AAP0GR14_9ASTR